MAEPNASFFARLLLAFNAFGRILTDPAFAAGTVRLLQQPAPAAPPPLAETSPDAALQLLGLLQQEGRFIDFLEEDVGAFSDTDIGAAARVVHEGCSRAVKQHFAIEPVRTEAEGSRLTLAKGFDAACVRLTGNVVGDPPFTGTLVHRGWRIADITLPKVVEGHDVKILAPAEVEL